MRHFKFLFPASILLFTFIAFCCSKIEAKSKDDSTKQQVQTDSTKKNEKLPKVTFVELGSVNCIPCKMMQPIMKAIEAEFGNQIEVVFHDVWKDPAPGRKYRIRIIPTQVFLDASGKEFFRHEGFLPKEEIEKLLVEKGLKILKAADIKN